MKSFGIPELIHEYAVVHSDGDPIAEALARATQDRFPDRAMMNIGHDQGRFMQMLVEMTGATTVVEVGTFTGMSALWLARGLSDGGRLICFDLVDTYVDTATEAWTAAGVADRIDMRIGPARTALPPCPPSPTSTWRSSTPTRSGTAPTSTCCCRAWPTAGRSSSTTCSGAAPSSIPPTPRATPSRSASSTTTSPNATTAMR